MKTLNVACAVLALGIGPSWAASVAGALNGTNQAALPPDTAYAVVERGANYQVWEKTRYHLAPDGSVVARKHHYTEMASGLNYQNARGQWVAAQEIIEPYSSGAIARQGQYQVIFANNLSTPGAIDQQTPDGKRLRSNILGLEYYDTASGQGILIAQTQDSQGQLISSNQVLYANAFAGVRADVRYTYKKGSFEQDVILREQPPTPESLGLDPQTTEIEVMTEFLNPPQEAKMRTPEKNNAPADDDVSWGAMFLGHGKAFDFDAPQNTRDQVRVARQYGTIQGRKILLEVVPVKSIRANVQKLPVQAGKHSKLPMVGSREPVLPKVALAPAKAAPMKMAGVAPAAKGYVLDYVELNSYVPTNFIFQSDNTYLINGFVSFAYYNNVIFEGGAVIKYSATNTSRINISPYYATNLVFNAGPYRPVIFTSSDDDAVGELISGSTGNPQPANTIYLDDWGSYLPISFCHFRYAAIAIQADGSDIFANDCQFLNCSDCVVNNNDDYIHLFNVLMSHCSSAVASIDGAPTAVYVQNLTADVTNFCDLAGYCANDQFMRLI